MDDLFRREILTVTQLTQQLTGLIDREFGLVWLTGEISNLRRPASGHMYFTLKDQGAQIRGVMFKNRQGYLAFDPDDGQEVLARGRLSIYAPRGEYQLVIDYMEPLGEGALRLAFERLKARLAEEGLFDEARKKKIPFLPRRVALVTSPSGAAVRDFIRVSRRRYSNVQLSIYPVRVQGEGAAGEIAGAVTDINRWGGFDVIVITRGGGSLEDLWAFNEEIVARAVAGSDIPVVSAVGHEVDFTIADFAADLRAPTPSAAAEMIFREKKELEDYLVRSRRRLYNGVRGRLNLVGERLAHLQTRLGDPGRMLEEKRLLLDDRTEELIRAIERKLEAAGRALQMAQSRLAPANPRTRLASDRMRLNLLVRNIDKLARDMIPRHRERLSVSAKRLEALSPLGVLSRGYALARKGPDGPLVRSSKEVDLGERLNVLLAQGELEVIVDEVIP